MKQLNVGMLSLGCPKTLVDSELVLGKLDEEKYRIVNSVGQCDIAFLNTCAFIQEAKQESIDRILELVDLKKKGKIKALVVLGCLFQRYPEELKKELSGVDAFLGTGEYGKIPAILNSLEERLKHSAGTTVDANQKPISSVGKPGYMYEASDKRISLTPKHFRYVKISEGCDHVCSFCSIPSYRGKHRSRPIADIVTEVTQLAELGAKEIVLTGQDTTYFGRDWGGKFLLPKLLHELNKVPKIEWLRLLYAYPACFNEEMIDAIASLDKVCHYIDMPLQHINDEILLSMKRGVTRSRTIRLIEAIRKKIPDISLRTTFIVGYPGETEQQFTELLAFLHDMHFDRLGIFTYSKEDGTAAAKHSDDIPESVKRERYERAMQLQQEISLKNNRALIGKKLRVLIDEPSQNTSHVFLGRSYMDAPEVDGMVLLNDKSSLFPGMMVDSIVTGAEEYDLTAVPV